MTKLKDISITEPSVTAESQLYATVGERQIKVTKVEYRIDELPQEVRDQLERGEFPEFFIRGGSA